MKNARTAVNGDESVVSIATHNGKIVAIADSASEFFGATTVVDAEGRWVLPGAIDTHSHLGQTAPGYEDREGFDMASSFEWDTRSALAGGVTTALNYIRFGQGRSWRSTEPSGRSPRPTRGSTSCSTAMR